MNEERLKESCPWSSGGHKDIWPELAVQRVHRPAKHAWHEGHKILQEHLRPRLGPDHEGRHIARRTGLLPFQRDVHKAGTLRHTTSKTECLIIDACPSQARSASAPLRRSHHSGTVILPEQHSFNSGKLAGLVSPRGTPERSRPRSESHTRNPGINAQAR